MLTFLRIRGLALLDDVTLELERGMNVLTGETGAGKSIIIDALTLLRGTKARAEIIRAGDDATRVDAQFELSPVLTARATMVLEPHGITAGEDPESWVVQRVVPRAGRGRCFVNAQLTTREVLAELGELLIDVCSQHEHHSLTQVARHIELLDAHAGLDASLAKYSQAYLQYRAQLAERQALAAKCRDAAARGEFLRFQLEELDRVAPQPGEYDELKSKLELLRDAQRWADYSRDAESLLYEAEDSVILRLGRLIERAKRGTESSSRLALLVDQLEAGRAACEEALVLVQRFGTELELSPGAVETAEERLHELSTLRRKHGGDLEDLATRRQQMAAELETLENVDERLKSLDQASEQQRASCVEIALGLRNSRRKAASQLSAALESGLVALHIPRARFEVQLQSLPPEQLGPKGLDRVEFLFSANPGEPPASLSRVASGGELSRVLLAIRGAVANASAGVATYVFDEVDAGVGGAVAEAIGQRLALAAKGTQVLCITHLPQIAAFAEAHFRVEKRVIDERTTTRVVRLNMEERVEELARMLGGARVTDTAREHARQLIAEAALAREGAEGPSKPQSSRAKGEAQSTPKGAQRGTPAATTKRSSRA